MHIIALDPITKEKVPINEATRGKRYRCKYCAAEMHSVFPTARVAHYACYRDCKHTSKFCINRENSNIVRTIDNIDDFFNTLYRDQKRTTVKDPHPALPPTGVNPTLVSVDIEPEDDDFEPEAITTKPFRSLKQLWDYGLDSLNPEDPESHSDIVIFEGWYKHLFRDFNGGNRVIQAKPVYVHFKSQTIEFQCSWQGYKRGKPTPLSLWRTFRMHFKDKKIFDEKLKELGLHKEEQPNGSAQFAFYCTSALIAGNWISCTDKQYAYSAECTSKKQIYAIKE